MKIREVTVKNFRLLEDVHLCLENDTTLVVGRNNSGKTSLTELFRRLLADSTPKFRLEDFSLGTHKRFWEARELYRNGAEKEVIREKLMPRLHAEVPYGLVVEIERMQETAGRWQVHAVIWVEREQHKAIVIGKGGKVLKAVGSSARPEVQQLLGGHVNLQLWVKVRESWSADENVLKRLGFEVS